jgi:hypothetical protein
MSIQFVQDGNIINLVASGRGLVSVNPADGSLIVNGPATSPNADANLYVVEILDNLGASVLTDRCLIALRSRLTGKYVTAQASGAHHLVAHGSSVGAHETFVVHNAGTDLTSQPLGVRPGAPISLRAVGGQFVAVEVAPSNAVSAKQWRYAEFVMSLK